MSKETGGPAFPVADEGQGWGGSGMTLRDRIAIEALGGMLAHSRRYKPRPGAPANWHKAISAEAYDVADAMLAHRNREAGDE